MPLAVSAAEVELTGRVSSDRPSRLGAFRTSRMASGERTTIAAIASRGPVTLPSWARNETRTSSSISVLKASESHPHRAAIPPSRQRLYESDHARYSGAADAGRHQPDRWKSRLGGTAAESISPICAARSTASLREVTSSLR